MRVIKNPSLTSYHIFQEVTGNGKTPEELFATFKTHYGAAFSVPINNVIKDYKALNAMPIDKSPKGIAPELGDALFAAYKKASGSNGIQGNRLETIRHVVKNGLSAPKL